MAIARTKVWIANEVLTASDLNSEFNGIIDNALSLVSPWTANMSAGGFLLTTLNAGSAGSPSLQFTGDTNTGVYRPAADTVGLAGAGVDVVRATGTAGGVNFHDLRSQSAGNAPELQAAGTDTNISLRMVPKGTGYVQIATAGGIVNADYVPGLAFADFDTGLVQVVSGTLDIVAQSRQVLRASGYLNATNYIRISNAQAGATPYLEAQGGDTNVGLVVDTQAGGRLFLGSADTGGIEAATYFLPVALSGGAPSPHALYRKNVPKAMVAWASSIVLLDSFNVTSLTDEVAAGYATVLFARAFSTQTYIPIGISTKLSTTAQMVTMGETKLPQTTECTLCTVRTDTMAATDASAFVVFFGDQ